MHIVGPDATRDRPTIRVLTLHTDLALYGQTSMEHITPTPTLQACALHTTWPLGNRRSQHHRRGRLGGADHLRVNQRPAPPMSSRLLDVLAVCQPTYVCKTWPSWQPSSQVEKAATFLEKRGRVDCPVVPGKQKKTATGQVVCVGSLLAPLTRSTTISSPARDLPLDIALPMLELRHDAESD